MKTILVVGGSGTLGKALIPRFLLPDSSSPKQIRVLSRHEHTQALLKEEWDSHQVDFFIGDVRDRERVLRAAEGCTHVYHLAATKRVETAEYDPDEAVKTNVLGTQNVIAACRELGIQKAIYISTDKAVSPNTVYGFTKALAERLWIAGNVGHHECKFSAIRYGNVLASQGSVLETWARKQQKGQPIPLVGRYMTRFWWTPEQAAAAVFKAMEQTLGGEVFIPKMKASSMMDLALAFTGGALEMEHTDVRPGEKDHEELLSQHEIPYVTETEDFYIKYPDTKLFPISRVGSEARLESVYDSKTAGQYKKHELEELCRASLLS